MSLTDNQNLILAYLMLESGTASRKQLVRRTRLPRTTVFDNLVKLEEKGFVTREARNNGKTGRPVIIWRMKPIIKSATRGEII